MTATTQVAIVAAVSRSHRVEWRRIVGNVMQILVRTATVLFEGGIGIACFVLLMFIAGLGDGG